MRKVGRRSPLSPASTRGRASTERRVVAQMGPGESGGKRVGERQRRGARRCSGRGRHQCAGDRRMGQSGRSCTCSVTSPATTPSAASGRGSPICRSPHARSQRPPPTAPRRLAVQRLRRPRPRCRARLRCRDDLVLREQQARRPRLLPPLAGCPQPGRHHTDQLGERASGRCALRRVPCQDVSTVGKRAGLAPGTRSGLWSHMATAIDVLQPRFVVIENVRGLLSIPSRPRTDRRRRG